ncbi:DUF4129 domain-containing protein [Halocatena marina]|nr:DUF4129 domain-containing protein [Halocatena marina]
MNRDQIAPLALALLAVLALGAAAATLNSVNQDSNRGTSEDIGAGGDGSTFDLGSPSLNTSTTASSPQTGVLQLLFAVLLLIGLVGLAIMIYQRDWRSLLPAIAMIVVLSVLLIGLYYALQSFTTPSSQNGLIGSERSVPSGVTGGAEKAVDPVVSEPSILLFGLLAVAIIVALTLLVRSTGDSPLSNTPLTAGDESTSDDSETAESAAIGEVAGQVADRIETDASLSNAIYRAWQEMTEQLDLQSESSTPGEFASAAVAAGMARDDVEELTTLFEATRYGNVDVSEEREQRALAALRRIEREYTEK